MITGTNITDEGLQFSGVYTNGYPTPYGNLLNLKQGFSTQLLMGASGGGGLATGRIFYRSKSDVVTTKWSDWQTIAYTTDDVYGIIEFGDGDTKSIRSKLSSPSYKESNSIVTIEELDNNRCLRKTTMSDLADILKIEDIAEGVVARITYEKYITNDGILEINVSYRERLTDLEGNESITYRYCERTLKIGEKYVVLFKNYNNVKSLYKLDVANGNNIKFAFKWRKIGESDLSDIMLETQSSDGSIAYSHEGEFRVSILKLW